MIGAPTVDGAAPSECNQSDHDSANEDEIADYVDASKLLLPTSLTLMNDVQEDEETCKSKCEGQKGSL